MSNETNVTEVTDVSRETSENDDQTTPNDTAANDNREETNNADDDTFPREYVDKLRKESAGYRERARDAETRADNLATQLHRLLIERDGRLADPDDLEFNADHLDDADAMRDAITDLIRRKPHLKARRARGDIGAGDRGPAHNNDADLISIMRGLQ